MKTAPLPEPVHSLALCAAETGWREGVFEAAAARLSMPVSSLRLQYPGGVKEVVDQFLRAVDTAMEQHYTARIPPQRVRDRITAAVQCRLEVMLPYREASQRLVAFYAHPLHLGEATRTLSRTVNRMWYLAGDTATDWNYYSKRLLLAGVYGSTLTVWLRDTSPNQWESLAFLERRIDQVMQLQRLRRKKQSA
jgi:ubiquinone biosynthesis protein COQ9